MTIHPWEAARSSHRSRRTSRYSFVTTSLRLLTIVVLGSSSSSHGQAVINIPAAPACRECTIDVQHVAVLGQEDGPGTIESENTYGVADGRGRYFLWEQYSPRLKVFDSRGRYLGMLGREGRGPGEFRGIGAVRVAAGDSIHVFDADNLTRSVFSPSFAFARSTRLEIPPEILKLVMLDSHSFVFAAPIHTPSRVGLPLHLVNGTGRIVRSFGSVSGAYRPDIPYFDRRTIAPAGPERIWSAHQNQYRIELWSTEGKKLREFQRSVSWFPAQVTNREPSPSVPPTTLLAHVWQDREGRLWTLIMIPDRNWRQAVERGGPHGVRVKDWNQYYDTVLEIIDPRNGRLLASRRVDEVVHFVGDYLLGAVVTGSDDVPFYHVWQAHLVSRGAR